MEYLETNGILKTGSVSADDTSSLLISDSAV